MTENKRSESAQSREQVNDRTDAFIGKRTREIVVERSGGPTMLAANIIWFMFGIIATLLCARFVLLLFDANSLNSFVEFIYKSSDYFVRPFESIFGATVIEAGDTRNVFEPAVFVALAVYFLLAWGLVKLIQINKPNRHFN